MNIVMNVWNYFATNILQQPAFMIGLIVIIGYILLGKKWYDVLAGAIKAIVGYLILTVGSGGLVTNFRPVLVGLKDRFNMDAMVIDPYFGQNAVTAGVEEVFGKGFGQAMILLLIAFIVNILLVRFSKFTKLRALFTTGHVQVQQAATAYWLIMFACPFLLNSDIKMLIVMALILGLYWAVGSNLTVKPCQEMTDGAGFCMAHQQMFGVALNYWLAEKLFGKKKSGKEVKKLDDVELPGFMSIFNENMVCTSILMLAFFGIILVILGKDYLVAKEFMKEADSMLFYVIKDLSLLFGIPCYTTIRSSYFCNGINTVLPRNCKQITSRLYPRRRLCSYLWFWFGKCSSTWIFSRFCRSDSCHYRTDCIKESSTCYLWIRSSVF